MALTDLLSQSSTPEDQQRVINRLSAQMQVNQQLAGLTSLDELLWRGAEAKDLVEAEQLFIYAVADGELITRAPGDRQTEGKGGSYRLPLTGSSIPAYVARTAEVVSIGDPTEAGALAAVDSSVSYDRDVFAPLHGESVRQLLCTPVVHEGKTIGVLEALNKGTDEEFDFMDIACLQEAAKNLAPQMHQVSVLQLQSDRLTYTEQLSRITGRIHAAHDIDTILLSLHRDLTEMFGVEYVTIYAVDRDNQELYSKAKDDIGDITEFRVTIDHSSISGHCAATQKTLSIEDVYDEEELGRIHHSLSFNRSYDKRTGVRTRQMLVAPLVFEGELHGVLQVMNPVGRPTFSDRDTESIKNIADALAVAFANKAHTAHFSQRTRFDLLMRERLLNEAQLANARGIARENALFIEDVLTDEFKISKESLLQSYSEFARRPPVDLQRVPPVPADLIETCAEHYEAMKTHSWVPVAHDGDKVIVAMEDPRNLALLDELQARFLGSKLETRVATGGDIINLIDRYFTSGSLVSDEDDAASTTVSLGRKSGDTAPEASAETKKHDPVAGTDHAVALREIKKEISGLSEVDDESGAQLVRLVNLIIEQAYHKGASDIHLEPYLEEDMVVRYRVDGQLENALVVPRDLRNAIVSRIKIMSDLDIAERRKPQDGKIKFARYGRLDIELRVATLPTTGACEDVVMRILAASKPIPLEKLGMSERNYREFVQLVEQPYGIILCVGPTGSGKTTTLHSALGFINEPHRKIWTAEDPVEITQRGLRQVQVNPKTGLTFAAAMRAFLRADPDVIMVGEMRDKETTSMGIEASLTGHLVFSTLHTNNAPETITRLTNMEVDVFSFGDALLGILAQRLARTLCKECKVAYNPTASELDDLRREYGADDYWEQLGVSTANTLYRAKEDGCDNCGGSGYRGRMGLHEFLVRSDEMKDLIYREAQAEEIRQVAMAQGMRTLKQDGIEKVLAGATDLRQVHKVCTQ